MGHNTDLGTTNLCSFFDDDMYRITDDFSEKNLLGIGDGWELHREKMACDSNGGNVMKVTVKTWFSPDDVAVSYYEDDLRFLTCPSICSHPNIAKLYGHCCEKELLSLVYKLDPLNTLDYQLHEEEEDFALIMRVKVALGIADVVTFLHNQASPLDPARIVLDRTSYQYYLILDWAMAEYLVIERVLIHMFLAPMLTKLFTWTIRVTWY